MPSKISMYEGHKVISLFKEGEEAQTSFGFGYRKAKLILDNITAIEQYVEEMNAESRRNRGR